MEIKIYKNKLNELYQQREETSNQRKKYVNAFLKDRYSATNINNSIMGVDFTIEQDELLLLFLNDLRNTDVPLTYWKGGRISFADISEVVKVIQNIEED